MTNKSKSEFSVLLLHAEIVRNKCEKMFFLPNKMQISAQAEYLI